uniref:Retrovirus-related Pol polyprotein from transposon TNT 1-94 n=1 Tax=Tanacetum cinerariifolium TaxID=118510 RepID=A0A6L2L205_TANCI|nr:retrovirus-related Pol polyprotein from transposon TNT 1-94 [Tanacetum cinerariifolium]
MHVEFEMSMMGELKEMLKKFVLEESKPMKTPMSSDTKLMKNEECDSVDSTKYQGMIGDMMLEEELRKELTMTLDGFRIIFHLPQATDNNHDRFVPTPKFSEMVPFNINDLGFSLELRSPSNFKTTGLVQPLQTLYKIFSRCLTTRVTGYDQRLCKSCKCCTALSTTYMLTTLACFGKDFTTAHDKYHNLDDDEMMKSIFNSGKDKDGVGMKIPSWMIINEMKLTENYQMTTSAPRTPNPDVAEGDSSAPRKSTVIRLRIPPRRSTQLTPPTPIPTTDEADDIILQDITQLKETEKLVEGTKNVEENVEVDSSTLRKNDDQNDPDTRLEPRSNKESPEVEITAIVQPVNFKEDEEESVENDYELKRKEKGKHVEELSGHILHVQPTQATLASAQEQHYQLYLTIRDNPQLQHDYLPIWIALKYKFERLHVSNTLCRPPAVRPRDQDDPHDDAHPEGENDVKSQKTSKHGTYVFEDSSSGQDNESKPCPSTLDAKLLEECYCLENRKEILVLPHPQTPTPVVQSCQRDPKALVISLVNQDLLYLKKGSSGLKKIVMSLYKFSAIIFPDDDIEERTSRWVDKYVKKFNPYARYNVEHWKNPHAKIFYIKKQKESEKPKEIIARRANGSIVSITESDYKNLNKNDIEDMYLQMVNDKVGDYAEIGLLWSLSVFIRSTVTWERVHDFQLVVESYQWKVNLTTPTITFPGTEKYKVFSIVSEPMYGIIYKKNKKEKRVIRHQEIHKFCDATLKRVLDGLKSYNNDVKHSYVTPSLSKEDAEYLQLFKEEIDEGLKHQDQMRH